MGSKSFKEALSRKSRKPVTGSKSFQEAIDRKPKKTSLKKKPIFKEEWGSTNVGGRSVNYLNKGRKRTPKKELL